MTWQLFLIAFLLLATAVSLLQRRLGQTIPQYNQLVNAVFFVGVHYPLGLITALVIGFNANIGWLNFITLLIVGISFPLTDLLAFRASKDVDAGLFGILNNLSPVITIVLAGLLLSQKLTPYQLMGAMLIILSALIISVASYSHSSKSTKQGIGLALISVLLLGLGTVYESWILARIGMGSLLVYGLGLQTFWMIILAWPQRRKLAKVINRRYGLQILGLSLSKSLKGLAFIAALFLSKSAAVVGAFTSFLPVMIVITAYVFLRERSNLKLKLAAAMLGCLGLAVLSLT